MARATYIEEVADQGPDGPFSRHDDRQIGADGALRGYVGGLARKAALLAGEGAIATTGAAPPQLELL